MEPVKHDFILQAGIFMGFAITSAVFGGIIIIGYSTTITNASCRAFCRAYSNCGGHGSLSTLPFYRTKPTYSYSYNTKMGLAAVILTLGIVEFGIGIWVSICLCVMKPCCTNSQVSFLFS